MSCERQPDYLELFLDPQFRYLPLEIPDSKELSPNTTTLSIQSPKECPPKTKECLPETTRDDRIRIQTALLFNIPHDQICKVLKVTPRQIQYACTYRLTPQKSKTGHKPLIRTLQRRRLEEWLFSSPSYHCIPWKRILKLAEEF